MAASELTKFMQAVTEVAETHGIVAFVVSAVTPTDDGFTVGAGAASRIDPDDENNKIVIANMLSSAKEAARKLVADGSSSVTYLN